MMAPPFATMTNGASTVWLVPSVTIRKVAGGTRKFRIVGGTYASQPTLRFMA
jgi:hypothetical protein